MVGESAERSLLERLRDRFIGPALGGGVFPLAQLVLRGVTFLARFQQADVRIGTEGDDARKFFGT